MCPARRPLAALAPHGITAVLARLPRSPRQDGGAHGGGGPVPHPGRAAARRPLRLRLSAAVAARAGGAGGGGLPSALPGAAEGHPAGALRAGSHRAGQVRHRQDLRVRHHRPGRRAVGEPRHADPDPGSHEGDRGPDPRRDHDHRHKNGRPGVPCVHRGHASEPGQEPAEEVPHRCGLPRADQAADRAGLPEHGQREAAGAGRGRQAAGGGQLPGAGQVRQSPALVAVCSCRCPLRVTALLVSPSWIYSSLPVNKQMLAVSATYPESLAAALTRYMREPTFVRLNPTDPALLGLKQYYKIVNSHPLPHKTFEEKTQHLQELFSKIPFNQALVFSNLHSRAQHLAEILTSRGFPAECISGNMNQNQRLDAMAKLKQFHCRVLISTDLTSRGIDAEKVNLVINLDVPLDWETYMHRIGRAGRFGTLGLAVTYCCRGEEENTMMKIAQKCNLQLLPLPEPIPPGMMEQFEDGQVEVKPAIPTAPVLNCDTVCPKPEQPELQPVQNGFPDIPQPPSNPPRDNSSAERPKKTPKQKQTKKCTNPAKVEKNRSPQPSSCHTEQRNQVKPNSRTDGQHSTQAPDEEALKQNLPKIPCLSSFKTQLTSPWSFSDFVEDYDYFIKEGSEREVEILRSYSGPGEQRGLPRNGDVEWEEMEHHPEAAADEAESADSDGSESSRGSLNSRANNGSGSSRASLNSRANNSCSEAFSDTQEPSPVPPARRVPPAFCPTPERPQEPSHSPRQKEAKKKVPKQNAKAKKSQQHQFCSPARSRAEEEQSCSSWEDAAHQGCSSEHHWRCYYQAWQSYYSALSHYSRSYWHLSCISAYHANSVYLQELLRDGD